MDLADWLTWETAKSFGNSSFFTSFIGALAGAAGGAWAAQRIADKVRVRDQLLDEVRSCNIAIELAHGICSTFLNLKEQHVKRLQEDYEAQRALVHAHDEGLRNGAIPAGTVLDIGTLDLQTLGTIPVGVVDLRAAVLQNVSAPARPRSLAAVLGQSIESLNETIRSRNSQVRAYRASDAPLNEKVAYLFGLPRPGFVDENFGGTVSAIYRQTDDCIFFSRLMCIDLADHGDRLRAILKHRFRRDAPRIHRVLWDDVEKKGLLPPDAEYTTWITGFPKRGASDVRPSVGHGVVRGVSLVSTIADRTDHLAGAEVAAPEENRKVTCNGRPAIRRRQEAAGYRLPGSRHSVHS